MYSGVREMMNILHVWDQAGVGCVLAKYQRIKGCQSKVIVTSNADKFGIYDFYSGNHGKDDDNLVTSGNNKQDAIVRIVANPENFMAACLEEAVKADVIHIHSRGDMIPTIRKRFGDTKVIVLHYHGTDIRGLKKYNLPHRSVVSDLAILAIYNVRRLRNKGIKSQAQKMADLTIVSTPDLLEIAHANSMYIPNPIDTDHFGPASETLGSETKTSNNIESTRDVENALTFNTETTDLAKVVKHFEDSKLPFKLEVHDRARDPVKYEDMPALLRRYKIYVDIRYVNGILLKNLSKTALEALACGLKVIDYQANIRTGLPSEHNPVNITSKLVDIYHNLQESKGTRRLVL
jgi:glycosyltransferase involved in cell wall biosynthesis